MTTTNLPSDPLDAEPARQRVAYLVLGMHRSGTSAVTQMLALAGAQLPRNLMPGDEHNARGYFEPWRIAVLNDERLRAAGSAWDDVFAYPFPALGRSEERRWLNRATDLFEEEFGASPHPLLKDPRVTVLTPFWRAVLADLDIAARCVIPVRHPLAVAGSLARRNGFAPQKSVLLWATHMLAAEAHSRDLPRAFISYDGLLADWREEARRIEVAHQAALPKLDASAAEAIGRFLAPELRHNRELGELEQLGWEGRLSASVYAWFEAAARGAAPDPAPLQAAAQALAERREQVGALVSPVTRDLDAARAALLDARQRLAFERDELEREIQALRDELDELSRRRDEAVRAREWALADIAEANATLDAILAAD